MAHKNEVMNPNLLISIDPDDIEVMEKMAKYYYDEDLSPEELDDKIDEMTMIIIIFQQLGLSFDVLKIKKIVAGMTKQRNDIDDVFEGIYSGRLSFLIPTNMTHIDFLASMLNNIVQINFTKIEKLIGKKCFKNLFLGNIPYYFVEGSYLKCDNYAGGS